MHKQNDSADDRCAICSGALGPVLLEILEPDRFERHVGIVAEGYRRRWIACTQCGSATDVHSDDARRRLVAIATGYYEVDFCGTSIGDKFARVMAMRRNESDNAHRVDRVLWFMEEWGFIARSSPVAPRVLDIGSGTGVFLAKLLDEARARGLHLTAVGIEPDPTAAAHLRQLARFEVIEGLFSAGLGLGAFELCTLNKVLEHLPDPVALLREVAETLARGGGVLYLEVPDVLTASHRPSADNVLGALHHHLYTNTGLEHLANRVGLEVLQLNRVFEPSGKISIGAFMVPQRTVHELARARRS